MHSHLPRLAPEYYRGLAMVHWTLTINDRATGWLNERFHLQFREILLHTQVRYRLFCPTYCLMPDHVHLVWVGIAAEADQRTAMKFLRTETTPLLEPWAWQRQAFDHVLKEEERKHGAFSAVCQYVMENPLRRGLVERWQDYAFCGAMMPGYPSLDPRMEDFREIFWRIYAEKMDGNISK